MRTLRFTCEAHGLLHEEPVECAHDSEAATRKVVDAHSAPYGAGCSGWLTVELLDGEGRTIGAKNYDLTTGLYPRHRVSRTSRTARR